MDPAVRLLSTRTPLLPLIPAVPLLVLVALPAALAVPFLLALTEPGALIHAFAVPGYGKSLAITLISATLGTATATLLALALLASITGHSGRWLRLAMPPLLATPHAAMAVGLAFLVAPSGWFLRLISPWVTGLERPPLWSVIQDPWGLSLAAGLALKELPFILLLALSSTRRESLQPSFRAALSLGYGRYSAFLKVIAPQLAPSMVLPVTIAFIYGLSSVDMGSVLGPTTPPPFAILALSKLGDPSTEGWRLGLALSLHLAVITLTALLAFTGLAFAARAGIRRWASNGQRRSFAGWSLGGVALLGRLGVLISALSLAGLVLWAFAQRWRFPAALPQQWTGLDWIWARGFWSVESLNTLWLALASSLLGLALALGFILAERRARPSAQASLGWTGTAILPLLIPQMTLIPALLLLDLTVLGLPPWALALWGHVMFTAAYAYLSLRGPVLSLDPRYRQAALALGRPPWQALLLVELPVLLRPLMVSLAIALSVSVAAYLPTLTLGQGRIETFTVEAVAAATGGSRRTAAQFALSQSFWALLFFFSALAVPNLAFRNRRGLAAHVT